MARAFIYFMKVSGDFEGFEHRKNKCIEWLNSHPEYESREIVIGESIENLFKKVKKDDVIVLHSIHFFGKLRYWSAMYDAAERSGTRIVSMLEKIDTFDKKSCVIMNIYTVFAQQEEEKFREIEPELCDKCRELLS